MTNYEQIAHIQNQIDDLKDQIKQIEQNEKDDSQFKIGDRYNLYNNDNEFMCVGVVLDVDLFTNDTYTNFKHRPFFANEETEITVPFYRISKYEKIK